MQGGGLKRERPGTLLLSGRAPRQSTSPAGGSSATGSRAAARPREWLRPPAPSTAPPARRYPQEEELSSAVCLALAKPGDRPPVRRAGGVVGGRRRHLSAGRTARTSAGAASPTAAAAAKLSAPAVGGGGGCSPSPAGCGGTLPSSLRRPRLRLMLVSLGWSAEVGAKCMISFSCSHWATDWRPMALTQVQELHVWLPQRVAASPLARHTGWRDFYRQCFHAALESGPWFFVFFLSFFPESGRPSVKLRCKTLFTTFNYTPETPQNRPG